MNKVFIACAGLMARRIAEICADMGLASAVNAKEASLTPDQLLTAARAEAADSIHPGDSPWARDPRFQTIATGAGLMWIGHGAAEPLYQDPTPQIQRHSDARLIELQAFGFGDGTAIHLFHRDVSVQIAGSPWIIEAPAPHLESTTHTALQDDLASWVRATRLSGPATLTYAVRRDTATPTRLGVVPGLTDSSGVTEMITGIDLIGSQIELAMKTLEPAIQEDIDMMGCALACRLYPLADAADQGPWRLARLQLPETLDDLKAEAIHGEGDAVHRSDESPLVNIVLRAPDRGTAVDLMLAVLDHVTLEGVPTNAAALQDVLRDPVFRLSLPSAGYLDSL